MHGLIIAFSSSSSEHVRLLYLSIVAWYKPCQNVPTCEISCYLYKVIDLRLSVIIDRFENTG